MTFFFKNQNSIKVKVEIEKANKLLPNIPKDIFTDLNELIHTGANLVDDKIVYSLSNKNRNTKTGWETRLK